MKHSFEHFLFEKLQVNKDGRFVLAVSGGIDSMCLWDLFRTSNLNFIIAHCNYGLRGEASDLDEKFVLRHARESEKVFTASFDVKSLAARKSISIQMAAREQRYTWFEDLRLEQNCDFIATAHHLDDQVETFFIQLMRKSGLPGLSGIPVRTEHIVRPMMFVGREGIEAYVQLKKIPFREDESNSSDIYLRNRIRRNLIPAIQKVLPDFKVSVLELMGNMKEVSTSMDSYFRKKKKELEREEGEEFRISIKELKNLEFPTIFLEHYIRTFGFGTAVSQSLYECLDGEAGRVFYSKDYRIVKDRIDIIIAPLKLRKEESIDISKSELPELEDFFLSAGILPFEKHLMSSLGSGTTLLDYDKLGNQIRFRKWQAGDYFFPLGLGGRKKLSDYFIDHKFTLLQKERQWIMCSGNDVCWVVGFSIDERFKITEETKQVLLLEQI